MVWCWFLLDIRETAPAAIQRTAVDVYSRIYPIDRIAMASPAISEEPVEHSGAAPISIDPRINSQDL
jgi:hypothetical protein